MVEVDDMYDQLADGILTSRRTKISTRSTELSSMSCWTRSFPTAPVAPITNAFIDAKIVKVWAEETNGVTFASIGSKSLEL